MDIHTRPEDFVDLQEEAADILCDLRYFTGDNFMACPLAGYEADRMLMTTPTAVALDRINRQIAGKGLALKIFDAYRPRRAVAHILQWAESEDDNLLLKMAYYPHIDKAELIPSGYLVRDSAHSRGSTVDLTLIIKDSAQELDMGTPFDFFDERSWPGSEDVTLQQFENRMLLRHLMIAHGFQPLQTEWWHFTLREEPYPDTWFDFPIV